jgi:hypothetical protein
MTTGEIRRILGIAADGKTDEQLERYISQLQTIASDMYDHLAGVTELDKLNDMRWAAYLHENPDMAEETEK